MSIRAEQVLTRCAELARFSESSQGLTRTFLSPPFHDCHRVLRSWMESAGLSVSVDSMGNLRGLPPNPQASRFLIGSHIDTVPNAGAYDGVLGVVLAIAIVEAVRNLDLPFALEVVALSEEEGVRFGVPFLGSRALIGAVDSDLLATCDANGSTIRQAIRNFGLDPNDMEHARLHKNTLGYLEFHIEQGPVLEHAGLPLAAVDAIVGQSRLTLSFTGSANHAGTTPMNARRDALAGAAEWIIAVEDFARRTEGLVATVGRLHVTPGASNVVPGQTTVSLDVRHASDDRRRAAAHHILQHAHAVCDRRHLQLASRVHLEQPTVPMDPGLVAIAERAIESTGELPMVMVSGAGHDAMILAPTVPSAMIFLRSPGGVSHHPSEAVLLDDVAKAIAAGVKFLELLAQRQ